jgi:hypothetical protein
LTGKLRNFRVNFLLVQVDLCIDQVGDGRKSARCGAVAEIAMVDWSAFNRKQELAAFEAAVCCSNVLLSSQVV